VLTSKQKICLEKAEYYHTRNYLTESFGKLYLAFCDDGYVSTDKFLALVKKEDNLLRFPTKVSPSIDFDKYTNIVRNQAIGKDTAK